MDSHCQCIPLKFVLIIFTWIELFILCESAACNDIPQVPHAELRLQGQTPPFQLGTAITFDCVSGFVTDLRVRQITCHEDEDGDAVWDELPYACKPKSCGFPGDVKNARRIGNVFTFSNNVTYVCNEGFKLRGTGTLYCMTTGIWRPALPSCEGSGSTSQGADDEDDRPLEGIKCLYPGQLENGHIHNIKERYEVDELITYECHDGKTGNSKCLRSGNWNALPRCQGEEVVKVDDTTKVNTKEVQDTKENDTTEIINKKGTGSGIASLPCLLSISSCLFLPFYFSRMQNANM